MQINRRFVIILICSLLWGLVVSLFFYRAAVGTGSAAANGPARDLVVAARPLSIGASITADSVKITRVPENLFPRGAFSKIEDVAGRPVISSIQADEAIVEARVAPRGSGFGVAPMIPPGMRAQSVRVNDVVGVAGFVLPGMRVDVLVTGRPPGADDTITATVLQNVTVLSAGTTVEADGKSQSISVPVVTLLVTPAEAESLTLAASGGAIQLVLRNSNDNETAPTAGRQLRELYARGEIAKLPPPVNRAAPAPGRPSAPAPQPHPDTAAAPPVRVFVPVAAIPEPVTMVVMVGAHKVVETFEPHSSMPREGSKQ